MHRCLDSPVHVFNGLCGPGISSATEHILDAGDWRGLYWLEQYALCGFLNREGSTGLPFFFVAYCAGQNDLPFTGEFGGFQVVTSFAV